MEQVSPAESRLIKNASIRCAHAAQVDPRLLKAHPLNPNKHPPKQIELFISILGYQGWRRPITVSKRSGYITKGHGAHEAAMTAGYSIVPVDYQDYESDDQELADIVADNQLQRMSEMDTGKLTELLVQLDTGFSMELTGLEPVRVKSLLSTVASQQAADPGLAVQDYGDEPEELTEAPLAAAPQFATESQHSGGPAHDQPHTDNLPAPQPVAQSHVRMIQLFFDEKTVAEFMTIVEHFQKKLEIDNTTDTVLAVLRERYSNDIL